MKSIVAFLVFLVFLFSTQISHADESKIGKFNFVYPYVLSPAYLSNHAGFTQQLVISDITRGSETLHAYTLGERLVLDMRVHDRVGIFVKAQASINAGGDISSSLGTRGFSFTAGESWSIQEGFNFKLLRNEETSTQMSVRTFFTYGKTRGVLVDTSNLQFDEEYYKSISLFTKIEDVINHLKNDVSSNFNKISKNSKQSSAIGSTTFSLAQALHPNVGLQLSLGISAGLREITTIEHKKESITIVGTNMDLALDISLEPVTPVTVQFEYSYQPQSTGITSQVLLCSLVYKRPEVLSFGPSIGKVFEDPNQDTWFGNITAHLFF